MVYDFIQNYFYVPEIHILPLFALRTLFNEFTRSVFASIFLK